MAGSVEPVSNYTDSEDDIDKFEQLEKRYNFSYSSLPNFQGTNREYKAPSPEALFTPVIDRGALTPRICPVYSSEHVVKLTMISIRDLYETNSTSSISCGSIPPPPFMPEEYYNLGSIPPTPFTPEEYYNLGSIPPTPDYSNSLLDSINKDPKGYRSQFGLNQSKYQPKTTNGSNFLDYINSNREEYRLEYGINQVVKIDETTRQISRPQQSLNDKEKFFDESVVPPNFNEERKESKSPEIDDKTKSASSKSPDNDKSFSPSNTNTPVVSSGLSSSTAQTRPVQPNSTPAQRNEPKPTTSPAQPVLKQGGVLDFWWSGLGARK